MSSAPLVLTLTLNPAVDLSTTTARLEPSHKLRCDAPQVHAGGGGVNVARVVHRLGGRVLALVTAGGPTGQRLVRLLEGEGVPAQVVPIGQDTRESFTVIERDSGREYRFVLPGPSLTATECDAALARAWAGADAGGWLVASGSLPPGVPADFPDRLAQGARERGLRLALDASGATLQAGLAAGVHLVKPSLRELRELTGSALEDGAAQLAAARRIVAAGQAQWVALSLGTDGAMLVGHAGAWHAGAVQVAVASTVGAGDAFLGALVWAMQAGEPAADALATASAAGAAAVMSTGTAQCTREQVLALRPRVRVTPIG